MHDESTTIIVSIEQIAIHASQTPRRVGKQQAGVAFLGAVRIDLDENPRWPAADLDRRAHSRVHAVGVRCVYAGNIPVFHGRENTATTTVPV